MSSLAGVVVQQKLEIGHLVYCISCGDVQSDGNILDCCDIDNSDTLICEACDGTVHEDDVIWVGGYCYCEDCTRYCEECDSSHLRDEVRWVDWLRQYMCDSCYDDECTECAACDKDIKKGDAHDAGGHYYCDECFRELHSNCEKCDEAFEDGELAEADGQFLCKECLDAEQTEQVLCVLAI